MKTMQWDKVWKKIQLIPMTSIADETLDVENDTLGTVRDLHSGDNTDS